MRSASASVRLATAAAALALVAGLTACVDPGSAPALPTDPPSASPTSPVATPTIEPTPGALPLGVDCPDLVDPDAVYALNPNLALLGTWSPADGSAGADALAADGVACRWVMESGGATMDVSAARLNPEEFAARESAAAGSGQPVLEFGDRGYFTSEGGVGTLTVFRGDVWLVVSSPIIGEPAELAGIVESALGAIPA